MWSNKTTAFSGCSGIGCLFTGSRLARSRFFACASLYESSTRGEADSLGASLCFSGNQCPKELAPAISRLALLVRLRQDQHQRRSAFETLTLHGWSPILQDHLFWIFYLTHFFAFHAICYDAFSHLWISSLSSSPYSWFFGLVPSFESRTRCWLLGVAVRDEPVSVLLHAHSSGQKSAILERI